MENINRIKQMATFTFLGFKVVLSMTRGRQAVEVDREEVIQAVKEAEPKIIVVEPVYRTVQVSTVKSGKTSLWHTDKPLKMKDDELKNLLQDYEDKGELVWLDEKWRPEGCVFAWRVPTKGKRAITAEDSFDMIIQWN